MSCSLGGSFGKRTWRDEPEDNHVDKYDYNEDKAVKETCKLEPATYLMNILYKRSKTITMGQLNVPIESN